MPQQQQQQQPPQQASQPGHPGGQQAGPQGQPQAANVVAPSHLVYQELASGQIQMYQLPPGFVPVLVSNTGSLQPLVSIPPQAQQPQNQPQTQQSIEVTNTLSVPQNDPTGSRRSSSTGEQGQPQYQGQPQAPPGSYPGQVMQQPPQQAQPQAQQQPQQPQIIQQQQTFQQPLLTSDSLEQALPPQPQPAHYQTEVLEQPQQSQGVPQQPQGLPQQPQGVPLDYGQVQQPQPHQHPGLQPQPQEQQNVQYLQQGHPVVDNYPPPGLPHQAEPGPPQGQQAPMTAQVQQQYLTGSDVTEYEHSQAATSVSGTATGNGNTMHLMADSEYATVSSGEALGIEASPSPQPGVDLYYLENAPEAEVAAAMGMAGVSEASGGHVGGEDSNVSTQGKSDVSGVLPHHMDPMGVQPHCSYPFVKPCVTVLTCTSLTSSTTSLSSLSSSFSCDFQNQSSNNYYLHAPITANQSKPVQQNPIQFQHQSISLDNQDYTHQQGLQYQQQQFRKTSVPAQQIQIHNEALLRRGSLPPALTSVLVGQLEASNRLTSRRSSYGTIATLATLREQHGDSRDISLEDLSQVSLVMPNF